MSRPKKKQNPSEQQGSSKNQPIYQSKLTPLEQFSQLSLNSNTDGVESRPIQSEPLNATCLSKTARRQQRRREKKGARQSGEQAKETATEDENQTSGEPPRRSARFAANAASKQEQDTHSILRDPLFAASSSDESSFGIPHSHLQHHGVPPSQHNALYRPTMLHSRRPSPPLCKNWRDNSDVEPTMSILLRQPSNNTRSGTDLEHNFPGLFPSRRLNEHGNETHSNTKIWNNLGYAPLQNQPIPFPRQSHRSYRTSFSQWNQFCSTSAHQQAELNHNYTVNNGENTAYRPFCSQPSPQFRNTGHKKTATQPFQPKVQSASYRTFKMVGSDHFAKPPPKPVPYQHYVKAAWAPAVRFSSERPLLIVTDLNGTLIWRKLHERIKQRPCLPEFMNEIFARYKVMIWTSAKPENANLIADKLMKPEHRAQCVAVWARDTLGLSLDQYMAKVTVYKKLEWVWDDPQIQAVHPEYTFGGRWGQHNTLLIDDSIEKSAANPYNLVHIPELTRERLQDEQSGPSVLREVAGYLAEACHYSDVSAFARTYPFSMDGNWGRFVEDRFHNTQAAPNQ